VLQITDYRISDVRKDCPHRLVRIDPSRVVSLGHPLTLLPDQQQAPHFKEQGNRPD